MKNRVVKAVCGVVLSAMLMTSVAIPVLADCAQDGHYIQGGTTKTTYPNADAGGHQIKTVISGECQKCHTHVTVTITDFKPHTPGADGKCTECRYQVWHQP